MTLYFFSGTGNSFRVSQWITGYARRKKYTVSLVPIEKGRTPKIVEPAPLTGILFPTHGFTAPWHIIQFAWNLPAGKGKPAFCVTTRAGFKIGRVYIPGISGSAPFLIAAILAIKGYLVQGIRSIDMPSNWFSLHPIHKQNNINAIINRAEPRAILFIDKILSGKSVWRTPNCLYEGIFGLLLSPVSIVYLFYGRFFLAKLFFVNNDCNGCGLCATNCSIGAIQLKGEKRVPFWKFTCESCMRCATICPQNAVEAGHSWGVLLYFIVSVPYGGYLLSLLAQSVTLSSESSYRPYIKAGPLLDILCFYPSLIIAYHLFFVLLRIPIIRYFFSHTTLTHYWKRYREPSTDIIKMIRNPEEEQNEPKTKHSN